MTATCPADFPPSIRRFLAAGLVLLIAGCATSARDTTASRWEQDIQAFEAADHDTPPPHDAILFVGSSSIRRWNTLAADFPARTVIQRGFGGSQMSDLLFYLDRIVLPYRPRIVVVYEGDNDLAGGKSPGVIRDQFETFCGNVHSRLPDARVVFIAVKPSPLRRRLLDRMARTNRLIADFCRMDDRLSFIDVYRSMLDERGEPREELFVEDRLHMNAKGYALWTHLIQEEFEAIDARGKR